MTGRKTKPDETSPGEVITRRTRKTIARKIADVDSTEAVEVPLLVRKPRKKSTLGRKKTDKGDGLHELAQRYAFVLKHEFARLCTDREFDGFEVSCAAMKGFYPNEIWVDAQLRKGEKILYRIMFIPLSYPCDLVRAAGKLYQEMLEDGHDLAFFVDT